MEHEIAAAVAWWTAQLHHPSPHEAGVSSLNDTLTLEQRLTVRPTADQLAIFQTALTEELTLMLAGKRYDAPHMTDPSFGTDYEPGDILQAALDQAQIHGQFRLPIRTVMWVTPGRVTVTCGYGAPTQTIYPTHNEEGHPSCAQRFRPPSPNATSEEITAAVLEAAPEAFSELITLTNGLELEYEIEGSISKEEEENDA